MVCPHKAVRERERENERKKGSKLASPLMSLIRALIPSHREGSTPIMYSQRSHLQIYTFAYKKITLGIRVSIYIFGGGGTKVQYTAGRVALEGSCRAWPRQ